MPGGEETVEPLETVLPMEETIEALLDHLLSPLLSARYSIALPPSDHQQDIVAKQMHAIVILCNYYHRKQFQKLNFLCFESFCKIACIFKPTLLMYMRYMHRSEKDSEVPNNVSKTEKMILDACDICNALDASKDSPDIEGWPISKVAVFLVSPTKEKCLLELCSATQQHWLLVDKNLEAPFKQVIRKGNTRTYALRKESTSGGTSKSDDVTEEGFEQLAYTAVKQETGISSSDLSILESHVTYSLDRERTSTLLYIMKYDKIVNKEFVEVPISDVINSVKGPIVKKGLPFVTTQVVEYFHILPYIEFIADWLSRDTTHVGSLPMPRKDFMDEDHSVESDRIPSKEDHEHNGNSGLVEKKVNFQKAKLIPIQLETIKPNRYDLTSLHGSSGGICNPYVLLDGLIDMKAKELSDRSLQNGQNEGILDNKNKTKDIITYYRKGSGSCMSGSSPANYSCKVVHEKHSLEPDRKPGMKVNEDNKKADFTEHLVNTQNKEMSKSESGIVKNVTDLPSSNIPSRAITKSENTTGRSSMEPDGSVTMKRCSVNYEPFQNGQTQDNLTSKKDATKNANIIDGACINGSSGLISYFMEPGRLTSQRQIINDKHCQSVQTQENALINDKKSGSSPKSQSISYECSHIGQAQDTVTGKKDATKNANEFDGTCTGGSFGPISSCMESDRLTTQNQIVNDKDHHSGQTQEDVFMHNTNSGVSLEIQSINYECFQNGQTQDAVASKKDDTNANVVDGTCIGGSSGPINSCMEPNNLTTNGQAINDKYDLSGQTQENAIMNITNSGGSLKNQSMNYQSSHNGQTQDIVMSKNDVTKNAKEVDGTCIVVSSGSISSCMEFDILTAQNKESVVQSAKMACEAKWADGGKAHTGGVNQVGIAGSNLPVVPLQFNSENNDRLHQVTESKKPALLQASLRVLQKKRNELCQQQRVITDEIAQCEMNIQTVLTEDKDNLASNVEPIIEALNILCSRQVQAGANVSSKERCSLQWLKRRKISEAIFSSKNTCQELDDICDNNSWTLPRYSVLLSGRLFQAKVSVVGTDFNFTCDGDLKSSPCDARESASTNMLNKLRIMACQRQ